MFLLTSFNLFQVSRVGGSALETIDTRSYKYDKFLLEKNSSDVNSESSQTTMIELFAKAVNGFHVNIVLGAAL